MSVQLTRYHEDLIEETDDRDLRVQVDVDGVEVAVTATATGDVATLGMINHVDGTALPREAFEAVVEAVDELRDRGFDVDVGPLGRLVERTQQDSNTTEETPDTGAGEDDEENGGQDDSDDGEPDEVECDVDGCDYAGSERGLAIHKGRTHSDGDAPESDSDERVEGERDQDQDESVESDGSDEGDDTDGEDDVPLPPWLDESPTAVMEDSNINRTLDDVLKEVGHQDSILEVHQRLATGTVGATKELLSRLGLTAPGDNDLIAESQQATRIPILRAIARDENE